MGFLITTAMYLYIQCRQKMKQVSPMIEAKFI